MSDYSSNFPTQRPKLNLVFNSGSGKLDSRLSYSRSSGGTYMSNEKALNSENLILQSQDFDTTWAKDSTLNAPTGSQTAPDGTSTAWLLTTAASGTGMPFIFQNTAAPSNNTLCSYVVHLKAGTASHAYISFRGQSSSAAWALIDFASPTSPTTGGSLGSISATSVALGSSWYRVALTFNTGTISSGYPYVYVGASDGTSPDSTGRTSWTYSGETLYAWGGQLSSTNSKVYNAPTTAQISREYAPLLKTAAADAPRFEYDASGNSEGLLIEAQATNLQRYGSDFASWSASNNVSISSNSAVGPNGNLEADLVVATSTLGDHWVYDNGATLASGSTYTGSVYVKDAGQRYVQLVGGSGNFGSTQWATFDLQTGSVDANGVTASASQCGNGWYRIQATMTATGSTQGNIFITLANSSTAARSPSFTGDDYSGVLLFGYQLEANSSASSLVDTGTGSSQLSRAADSCSVALNGFGVDVTMATEFSCDFVDTEYRRVAELSLESGSGLHTSHQVYNGSAYSYATNTSGSNRTLASIASIAGSSQNMVSTQIGSTAFAAANGVAGASESNISADMIYGKLHIGEDYNGARQLNGHIQRVALFNTGLAEAKVTALSN